MREQSLLIDELEDFYTIHHEPSFAAFRALALSILLQAKRDAILESRGKPAIYGEKLPHPVPSEWLFMQVCDDWCRAADVSVTAYRSAVLTACAEARNAAA